MPDRTSPDVGFSGLFEGQARDASYERWAHPATTRIADMVVPRLSISPGMAILDIGAGLGNFAVPAARLGAQVVAIDNAPTMVDELRHRLAPFPRSRAELRDLYDLPLDAPQYDIVVSILCVAMMEDADDLFARMAAMTRPGGQLCVVNWASEYHASMFEILARALRKLPVPEDAVVLPGRAQFVDPSDFAQVIDNASWRDVDVRTVEVRVNLPPPNEFLRELDPFFQIIPAYTGLAPSDRDRLQPLIEEEFRDIPRFDGIYGLPAPTNIAIGRAPGR